MEKVKKNIYIFRNNILIFIFFRKLFWQPKQYVLKQVDEVPYQQYLETLKQKEFQPHQQQQTYPQSVIIMQKLPKMQVPRNQQDLEVPYQQWLQLKKQQQLEDQIETGYQPEILKFDKLYSQQPRFPMRQQTYRREQFPVKTIQEIDQTTFQTRFSPEQQQQQQMVVRSPWVRHQLSRMFGNVRPGLMIGK